MYINFWYPVIRSEDLANDKPERIKMLGLNFVAFRDDHGNACVLSDTCVHRGGSLGGAWSAGNVPRIVNGCIVCPYHGWEFNGEGKCVNIPSIGYGKKTPARAKVDAYPVQEKYGIVFAFLGDLPEAERPPLLNLEEYDDPAWRANSVLVLDVPYYYERSIENGLDPAHNEFVHPTHGHQGLNRSEYKVNPVELDDHRQGWGSWFWHLFDAPPLPDASHETAGGASTPWEDRKQERQIKVGGGTYGPNAMPTYINISPTETFRQYFFEAPVDESNTRIFFVNMRNFMLDPSKDGPIHARNKVIAQQDIQILTDLNPRRTPISNTKEVLMPADGPIAAYRDWLAQFDEKGWRIDWDEFQRRNGKDTAFAIPSPGRRQSGNWVLEAVPLLDSRAARKRTADDKAA